MANPTLFCLRLRGNDIWLATGEYVIGRSVSCHVVLDDSSVSRRHARLSVTPTGATIVDLGSVNGTFVNGARLDQGPRVLSGGDVLTIGNSALEFLLVQRSASRGATSATRSGTESAVRYGAAEEDDLTDRADGLVIVGLGADSAIAAGRIEDAERFLGEHLAHVLSEVRAGRSLPDATIQEAVKQSLRLAEATLKGGWLDYAVSLLAAAKVIPSDESMARMRALLKNVPFDGRALRRCHSDLHGRGDSTRPRDDRRIDWVAELWKDVEPGSRG